MSQALDRFRRRALQTRLDPRGVELGRGEQRSELVVQLAREAAALVLARGLQVLRELGELRGTTLDLALEPVALGLDRLLALAPVRIERRGLAQIHAEREQADRAHRRDADAVQQQGVEHIPSAGRDLARFGGDQLLGDAANLVHLLLADVGQ